MKYIVTDLEWNGAYSKKAHGYFNEIIDVGAVAFDEQMCEIGTFHQTINPVISKKLSSVVKELTHITQEELEEHGGTFDSVMSAFAQWAGDDAVLLTWSNTDVLVLMENFTFFKKKPHIPFMAYYADIQPYCQQRMGVDTSQQMGLSRACEQLGISAEGSDLHRALDDAELTAKVFAKLFEKTSFLPFIRKADEEFYARMLFKPTYINDIDSPLIKRSDLSFACECCGKNLHRKTKWGFRGKQFIAEFVCRACKKTFTARVQYKQTFDGIEVKRRLREKLPPEKKTEEAESVE